ncbi:bacteriophytochrome [Variibacter gotjawalensis]|uniref:histidine kinase n=1 Tax=Variibacter gotjawalensis TaxID=1333996 RepID=A0A0S3PU84_9BRAD|nr:GAF domain-containing sensor histidine kinase [Variibacter gotjawalensis]NIK49851.1 signal transduction histidine kinase [Variibacter gotjawalensis]RZS45850.1 GAF domain-containing protein [Variibacter gotjawalensis]BAT59526.1 bacteriophytochrome [Variibacter gotjawalensis]
MTLNIEGDLAAVRAIAQVPQILKVVCGIAGVGFAAVARVTPDRWICLAVNDEINFGLAPGGELKVETTICHEIRQSRELVVIDDVDNDPTYCDHPTPAMYGFKSYISVPIFLTDGEFFGTLCAIHPKPASLSRPAVVDLFKLFADLMASEISANRNIEAAKQNVEVAQSELNLREKFIAVLGHDLRNPLAAVSSGVRLLQRSPSPERASQIMQLMDESIGRMVSLIDSLLDFARGKLGGGLTLDLSDEPLRPILSQVVAELQMIHPERTIDAKLDLTDTVIADRFRIGQMFSNLLGNALAYSDGAPVRVEAFTRNGRFVLAVSNTGEAIPQDAIPGLFTPFARGHTRAKTAGLGLGLYIVAEIAKAHQGAIDVASDRTATVFTFSMPLKPGN